MTGAPAARRIAFTARGSHAAAGSQPRATTKGRSRATRSSTGSRRITRPFTHSSFFGSNTAADAFTASSVKSRSSSSSVNSSWSPWLQPSRAR